MIATIAPDVGQVWRGVEHGGLFKVLAADDSSVTALVMYVGNPYWADTLGTIKRFNRDWWQGWLECPPEWNDPRTDPNRSAA